IDRDPLPRPPFSFTYTAPPWFFTLSLHDALPIWGLHEIVVAELDIADRVDEVPAREKVRDLPVSGAVVGEVGGHGFIGDVEVDAVQIPPVGELALEGGEELYEERAVGGVGCGRVPAEVRAGAAGVGGEIEGGRVFGAPLGE